MTSTLPRGGAGYRVARGLPVLLASLMVVGVVLGFRIEPRLDFVAAGVSIVVGGTLVSRAAGLSLRRLTVPGVWYYSYLTTTIVPAMLVASEIHTRYVPPFLFAVVITLFTAPLGMWLVNIASGGGRHQVQAFFQTPVDRRPPGTPELAAFVVVLAVTLVLTAGYLIETPVIPLLYLLRNPGSALIVVGLREESFKLLNSPFVYFYDIIRNVVYPFLIALALGYYLLTRRLLWLVLFLGTAGIGVFYAAASIAKTPVAVIMLVTALFVYLYRSGRFGWRTIVFSFLAVFVFPVAVVFQSFSGMGFQASDIALAIVRRVFYVPAEVLYNYFVVVPDIVPYLNGRTIGRVQWILGESNNINIANFVFQRMFPTRLESGLANTSFLGYLHADFGLPGILLGGALAGALMQLCQLWLSRRPKTMVTLAAYAYFLWVAWKVNSQSLTQILLSGGAVVILLLVGTLRHGAAFFAMSTARPPGSETERS
jgi:oligosaccharide repeat unit polymerase